MTIAKSFYAVAFGLGIVAVVGCGSNASDEAASSTEDEITTDQIMARAVDYLTHDIQYCGGARGQYDGEKCGHGVCNPPAGPWDNYRSDCSGFVSYVWQIPSDPSSGEYDSDRSGSQGWSTVAVDDLRAGDAIVTDGHIKLFADFTSDNTMLVYEQYECDHTAHKQVQTFSRAGADHLYFDAPYRDHREYHAIRRNSLTAPPPPPKKTPPPPPPAKPPVAKGPTTGTPTAPTGCGILEAGTGLASGAAIRSCDARFELVMQPNGDLAEYGPLGAMWSTNTAGKGGEAAVLLFDGNFVVYGKSSNPLWLTGTQGNSGARLLLQDDGNIVIYTTTDRGLWASSNVSFPSAPAKPAGCGALTGGQGLVAGETLASCDGRFSLAMQTDGNLVIYDGSRGLWASNTEGKKGYDAVMQTDGNFVVYDARGAALWSTATAATGGSFLEMQTDGNLVVYNASSKPVWATGSHP